MNLRRIRGFLQLNQRDVELATGIPVYRLAKAEAGTLTLNDVERRVLEHFYRIRWKLALEEGEPGELEQLHRAMRGVQ